MEESTIVEIKPVNASTNSASMLTESQKMLRNIPPIHKVPANNRNWKEEAFKPEVHSIGPYHCSIGPDSFDQLRSECAENHGRKPGVMDDFDFDISHYYKEDIDPNYVEEKLFVGDANKVIDAFLCEWGKFKPEPDGVTDLLLLENQLPFFLIEEVFGSRECPNTSPSLIELAFHYFDEFNVEKINSSNVKIEHFTDLVRTFYLPPSRELPKRGNKKIELEYTATQLQEAGIKFKVSSSSCILDFNFDFKKKLLQIPCLNLKRDKKEVVVRNVLALEQTRYEGNEYVSDYVLMLSSLIRSVEDVDLLRRERIIVFTDPHDDTEALSLFTNLRRDINAKDMNRDYILICKNLNKFHNRPGGLMHIWKKPLKRDYCSNPWRTASTIAAILFLVFTFVQTVCSVIQVLPKKIAAKIKPKQKVQAAHTAVSLADPE